MKKKMLCFAAAAVVLLGACGSGNYTKDSIQTEGIRIDNAAPNSYEYDSKADVEYPQEPGMQTESTGAFAEEGNGGQMAVWPEGAQSPETNRKLIKTVNLSVETQEFDNLLQTVENKTAEYGGYIEQMYTYNGSMYSSSRNNKNASLTLRVPKENLSSFLTEVGKAGNITSRSESVEDVTLTYVDMESHKKVLQAEQERLLGFLEQAQTIEEIITIESRLSNVRYQIESMESQLRTYDNQVDYSTVYMDITEVTILTPQIEEAETIWQRIGRGFMNSTESIFIGLQEMFVWFITILPYLIFVILVTAVIIGIVAGSVKLSLRKKKKKNVPKADETQRKAE